MIKVELHNDEAITSIEGSPVIIMAETCSVIRFLGTIMAEKTNMSYRQAVAEILKLITVALQAASDEG